MQRMCNTIDWEVVVVFKTRKPDRTYREDGWVLGYVSACSHARAQELAAVQAQAYLDGNEGAKMSVRPIRQTVLHKRRIGDTFHLCGQWLLRVALEGEQTYFQLCHGTAYPDNGLFTGVKYRLAWLELGRCSVMDWASGKPVIVPISRFYEHHGIDRTRVLVYSQSASLQLALTYKHWGPWDDA